MKLNSKKNKRKVILLLLNITHVMNICLEKLVSKVLIIIIEGYE